MKKRNLILAGALLAGSAAFGMDEPSTADQFLQGLPVTIVPASEGASVLNYEAASEQLKSKVDLQPNEHIIARYHAESEEVDLSTFDGVSVTVPIYTLASAAPNWST
jgi:hypothetical protein